MAEGYTRTERDSLGEVKVPAEALWGAQTQRAVENFPISGLTMPRGFIHALGLIKWAAAEVNGRSGRLAPERAQAIAVAALAVAEGHHDVQFPVDVFQTGSGTSSNMNANEVIARLAALETDLAVHPNDHVNLGQSSNDVVPTAIHVGAALALEQALLPALAHLEHVLGERERELADVVKTGRTHLMDAMPLTLAQELSGWRSQLADGRSRLADSRSRLLRLALGGTAVGTGVNAPPGFAAQVITALAERTGIAFRPSDNHFAGLAAQDTAVELSGHLRTLAVSLLKITNDLRWMNSGPLAGLGEITLPALQPGSSIMPGKVNPVIPEAVAMAAVQVMGNDAAIAIAGQSGNFELNVMLPLIAYDLLQSIGLLASSVRVLADKAVAGFAVQRARLEETLAHNPVLVTALNPVLGYERAAEIAKEAYRTGRPILEVAAERSGLPREELERLLDPRGLTGGEPR